MALKPFIPLDDFIIEQPVKNHSYRTYKYIPPGFNVYDLMVSNGLITEVIIYDLSVSDAEAMSNLMPVLSLSTTSMGFADTPLGENSDQVSLVLTNIGTAPLEITELTLDSGYSIVAPPTLPFSLSIGSTLELMLFATPDTLGSNLGSLAIVSNAASSPNLVSLLVQGLEEEPPIVMHRFHTDENQILTEENVPFRFKAVNWFGGEGSNYTPHGTWQRSYQSIIDQIKEMGFNCIRLPFSGDTFTTGRMPVSINYFENPDLEDLNTLEVYDKILDYCASKGIYVLLDHHRRSAGAGADGSPVDGTYTSADWLATWELVALRWYAHPAVMGADLHNEPHDLTWSDWCSLVGACSNVIQSFAPDWLMIVEGVGEYAGVPYWWGGQLAGVADLQPTIYTPNTLVYSPHEYGQSVAEGQAWLDYDGGGVPVNWPYNLHAKWTSTWSFIFFEKIAPVLVGEFGGHFGYNTTGTPYAEPHWLQEQQWLTQLCISMNGSIDENVTNDIDYVGGVGMSFAYWSFNPNSADTGGLLQDDWVTPQSGKLVLIQPILED